MYFFASFSAHYFNEVMSASFLTEMRTSVSAKAQVKHNTIQDNTIPLTPQKNPTAISQGHDLQVWHRNRPITFRGHILRSCTPLLFCIFAINLNFEPGTVLT